ncbi:MAG: glucose-1-phosphate adenylyltransferase [Oscillospiraceae bacterium]|jgi:glucose-1-phosphate adenylyltransferase|nr:glucose-1-phosphate adenylyltransferase [Oscillospiraceae bacterium]
MKKTCVAMLLAGGQGSRLSVLTAQVAKPAVPFGGRYRLIDFPLSNCANSDIDTVGILTQYQPHALHSYVGSGLPWDLDRLDGGVHILPPHVKGREGQWYKGSANAIYQNINFIDSYEPEYVLVLAGDHIYKMDYRPMLAAHIEAKADATVAVKEVSQDEASRFGIMIARPDGTIYDFEEKPEKPKSTLASMGIYIFTWEKLRRFLIEDENTPDSKNDFGGNIIPNMLAAGEKMTVYRFSGYWKDVGTIESLWDANMDMLSGKTTFDLFDPGWRIYSRNATAPPYYCGDSAVVSHSLVTEGCEIYGQIYNSVLFNDVTVAADAQVRYSILMPGVIVEPGAIVQYAIVAEDAIIRAGARVGQEPLEVPNHDDWGITVIAGGVTVPEGDSVPANRIVGKDGPL